MKDRNLIKKDQKVKYLMDKIFKVLFVCATLLASSALIIIIVFVVVKGVAPFLSNYPSGPQNLISFLFGNIYRQDQQIYGIGFIIINTLLTGFIALLIVFPIAVLTALFIVKMADKVISTSLTNVVELLASIPSVVYGIFAAGVITQFVAMIAKALGFQTAGGSSMLATVFLLAIMIFPTITALSISAIKAVDRNLELGSLALGATVTQTNFKIVLKSAKSGIFAGAILGLGRAFGEATAVSMVVGNKMFGPTFNPFDITRTLTSTMLAGMKETTGLDYDIRFSIGIVLIIIILISNYLLNYVKDRIGNR